MTTREGAAVPTFDSVEELQEVMTAKRSFSPIDLYPRDGTEHLCAVEARAANLARVEADGLVMFNSGMSAVQAALEVGLSEAKSGKDNGEQLVVAHSYELYSQTLSLIGSLRGRGVKPVAFDSGSPASIEKVMESKRPDVLFTETVGNGPNVPVLDIDHLLALNRAQAEQSFVILDNTLPLSTALPLGEMLDEDDRVLVVESGTKSYTLNNELSGFVYGAMPSLMKRILEYRRTVGVMPGLGSLERIDSLLPASREAFDERNGHLYEVTGKLAVALFEAEQAGADFIVSHPSLATHANHELAATRYSDGTTPVFFLQCTGEASQFDLADRLWSHPIVRQYADLGQSFGFDKTRILPDERYPAVRVAGGAYSDTELLGPALKEAALKL